MTATQTPEEIRDAFAERLVNSVLGTFDVFAIYIGDRMGFYEALDEHGPMRTRELAETTNTHERYVREWAEHQAVSGVLEVVDTTDDASNRKFVLPAGHAEVLAEKDSLSYLAPITQLVAGVVSPLDQLLTAYRQGGGVSYADYGHDLMEGQARMNRAAFLHLMGTEWLPTIPELHQRLQTDPPARVADVGCGAAWSCIGIAQHYPKVQVDGFDLDEASVAVAQTNIAEAGLSDRVSCKIRDAGSLEYAGQYDLVAAFECVHDMSQPEKALAAMRNMVRDDGMVIICDERVGESFTPDADDTERLMYGWSFLHCLPVGMADHPSAETGTVMRPDTLRRYAREAGFDDIEILPIENDFFRFYRLV